jgi:hypothetical protein
MQGTAPVNAVVLRTPWTTYVAYVPVVAIASILLFLTPDTGLMRPVVDVVVALWLASLLVRLPFVLRMRVELRPDALVVQDRQRWQIASTDITDIAVVSTGSLGSTAIYVNDVSGAHELVALRAFWPWQRARLEQQRELLRQWWSS